MKSRRIISLLCLSAFLLLCCTPAASALYEFEGIPLTLSAQGAVPGEVLTFGTYGLAEPPMECTFDLPAVPVYARVYAGVWGGTEDYTGWADITVNDAGPTRFALSGTRDTSPDISVSSHGIYWIAADPAGNLREGQNTVTVTTSRGEAGNRLDGRVYAVCVVAVVEKAGGTVTQYWIAEGNENLHGEGWAGSNPTRKDTASVSFGHADRSGMTAAELMIVLLASNRGQPDYLAMNGRDLGSPSCTADIGNERSFDADGGGGIESRYVDAERFDVTALLERTNTVLFERGRDQNGDGTITSSGTAIEGEDYIHPCLAVLTLERSGTDPLPDLVVERIRTENAYAGETATAVAEIKNYGSPPATPVTVTFDLNGNRIGEDTVTPDPAGNAEATVTWPASGGAFTLTAAIAEAGSRASVDLTIGSLPDLAVTIGTPYRAGAGAAEPPESPLSLVPLIAGLGAIAYLRRSRPPGSLGLLPCLLIAALLTGCLCTGGTSAGAGGYAEYLLPVHIENSGGSDAPSFPVTVYLDGEKAAYKPVDFGVAAGSSTTVTIPLYTTPGTHRVRVVLDETGAVREQTTENNIAEGSYGFP
ncbi:DUF3344 domain-containing protein [Methanoculleus sp. FWC-SCC1]|uniref:DUF3344 domain-containing protein n=1 Tax=Methanoculleus frigidifontis TaxID=2584085 RepID=A0ABT8M7Z9_9EURY|nr:DUF3344 domain-containing protein [Methanoculleus sp. FWC-SCC1]MDN7024052.1 DUF3344 domain-containing protein [Methanoculleus sp. FWC-SCC1]